MATPTVRSFKLSVSGTGEVTAKADGPAAAVPGAPAFLIAHGAANDLDYPLLTYLGEYLARAVGATVLRFNFPYVERGAEHSSDPGPVLEETFRSAYGHLTKLVPAGTALFVGGKSLGGRVAAELISRRPEGDGLEAAGLVELGYPLHAPGRTDRVNVKPLRHIDVPSLFCIGSRDTLCHLDLLRPILPTLLAPAELYVVEGGDHSLVLSRSSGKEPHGAYPDVAARVADFLSSVTARRA
jgi:predicted alpha/beta-hydrolase family hydrolase